MDNIHIHLDRALVKCNHNLFNIYLTKDGFIMNGLIYTAPLREDGHIIDNLNIKQYNPTSLLYEGNQI